MHRTRSRSQGTVTPRGGLRLCCALLLCVSAAQAAEPVLPAPRKIFPLQPDTVLDGKQIPHQPGDVFGIQAGKGRTLKVINFTGTSARPIVFANVGGIVDIANEDRGYAIAIQGCTFVRFAGIGPIPPAQQSKDPLAAACGFRAKATKKGMMAVHVNGRSSDIEVDHVEVYGAGFAGFNVKDEPQPDGSTNRDRFVMYNISIHDNYVHDVEGEGFYIGHTFYGGWKHPNGQVLMPHVIKGLRVYNNQVRNSGCEGIQVGSAVEDCEIYHNTIIKFGQRPFAQWQDNGMQVGGGTQAKVYGNYLEEGPGAGLTIHGLGKLEFLNNVIVRAGTGAYVNTKEGDSYLFAHNTFVASGGDGLRIGNFKDPPSAMAVYNNLVVGVTGKGVGINNLNNKAKMDDGGNVVVADLAQVPFKDAKGGDYRPANLPALRKTVPVPGNPVTRDQAGMDRPKGSAPLAGAYEPPAGNDPAPRPAGAPPAPEKPTPWKNKR